VFVFLDEHPDSIDDGLWGSAQADPYNAVLKDGVTIGQRSTDEWVELPADRHNRGANLSFADGHVAYQHWKAAKKFSAHGQRSEAGGDRDDLRYMQSVLPRLR